MTRVKTLGLAALIGLFAGPMAANAKTAPTGVWLDHTGRGAVEIKQCGHSLCGRLVWLKDKGNSKLCGTRIIGGVRKVGRKTWDRGWIYSPERGSRFDVQLTMLKSGKLRVLGYAGVKFLSETMIWRPAPENLERCDRPATFARKPETRESAKMPEKADPKATLSTEEEIRQKILQNETTAPQEDQESKETTPDTKAKAELKNQNRQTASRPTADEGEDTSPPPGRKATTKLPKIVEQVLRSAKRSGKKCKLDLPYFTVSFPCPDEAAL